jgi:hypothetical protein
MVKHERGRHKLAGTPATLGREIGTWYEEQGHRDFPDKANLLASNDSKNDV